MKLHERADGLFLAAGVVDDLNALVEKTPEEQYKATPALMRDFAAILAKGGTERFVLPEGEWERASPKLRNFLLISGGVYLTDLYHQNAASLAAAQRRQKKGR